MRQDAQIQLTEQEEAICQLLDQTCSYIHRERPEIESIDPTQRSGDGSQPCEARIAGGWVRDKLLARDSDDLDISLSTLTGNAFALYLKHYLSSPSFAASPLAKSPFFREDGSEMGRIGKIAANPEQSKNLETATARVLGLSLDFVNLRKESYDPGSRIPTMTFGTPKEDAERRDITINSLLYNVHTRRVEDHTGLGLQDLAAGLIRTPLPPLTTFLDDPLRVLRCVRFSSRFAYELHPTIIRCLTGTQVAGSSQDDADSHLTELASKDDPRIAAQGHAGVESGRDQIREALVSKVSRERFGIEVDKMIKGPHPLLALFLLHRLELFPLVFHPPPSAGKLLLADSNVEGKPAPDSIALNAARLLDAILKGTSAEDPPVNQSVAIDGLRIGDGSSDSQDKSELSRVFSSLPLSPLPNAVFQALPSDLLASWSSTSLSSEERRRLWITMALLPLRHLIYEKKNKLAWAGESVIANGLKLGTKTLKEPVASLHKCMELLRLGRKVLCSEQPQAGPDSEALDKQLHLPPGLSVRSRLGLLLRNPHVTNAMLQLRPAPALLTSFIAETIDLWAAASAPTAFDHDHSDVTLVQEKIVALAQEYGKLWGLVQQWRLVERAEEKPALDGNAVTAALGCHPRLISQVQTYVLAWQYDQEEASADMEERCKAWLKAEWEKGGIVPVDQRPAPPPVKADKAKKKGPAPQQQKAGAGEADRRKRQKSE